jgi:hypothetical protein
LARQRSEPFVLLEREWQRILVDRLPKVARRANTLPPDKLSHAEANEILKMRVEELKTRTLHSVAALPYEDLLADPFIDSMLDDIERCDRTRGRKVRLHSFPLDPNFLMPSGERMKFLDFPEALRFLHERAPIYLAHKGSRSSRSNTTKNLGPARTSMHALQRWAALIADSKGHRTLSVSWRMAASIPYTYQVFCPRCDLSIYCQAGADNKLQLHAVRSSYDPFTGADRPDHELSPWYLEQSPDAFAQPVVCTERFPQRMIPPYSPDVIAVLQQLTGKPRETLPYAQLREMHASLWECEPTLSRWTL